MYLLQRSVPSPLPRPSCSSRPYHDQQPPHTTYIETITSMPVTGCIDDDYDYERTTITDTTPLVTSSSFNRHPSTALPDNDSTVFSSSANILLEQSELHSQQDRPTLNRLPSSTPRKATNNTQHTPNSNSTSSSMPPPSSSPTMRPLCLYHHLPSRHHFPSHHVPASTSSHSTTHAHLPVSPSPYSSSSNSVSTSTAPVPTTNDRLTRLLCVVKRARLQRPVLVPLSTLHGPPQTSSFLVDCVKDDIQFSTTTTITSSNTTATNVYTSVDFPIVINNCVVHGVHRLLLARNQRRSALLVNVLCDCGSCVTTDDMTKHYSLVVLASHMTSNATVPMGFVRYVEAREREVQVNERAKVQRFISELESEERDDIYTRSSGILTGKKTGSNFPNAVGSTAFNMNRLGHHHRQEVGPSSADGNTIGRDYTLQMELRKRKHQKVRFSCTDVETSHTNDQSHPGVIEVGQTGRTANAADQRDLNLDTQLDTNTSLGQEFYPDADLDENRGNNAKSHRGVAMRRRRIIDMDGDDLIWFETKDSVNRRPDRVSTTSRDITDSSTPSTAGSTETTPRSNTILSGLRKAYRNRPKLRHKYSMSVHQQQHVWQQPDTEADERHTHHHHPQNRWRRGAVRVGRCLRHASEWVSSSWRRN